MAMEFDETAFWKQKLIQFFHDPVNKPFTGYPRHGKQTEFIKRYSSLFIDHEVFTNKLTKPADHAAAGADRPVLFSKTSRHPIRWYQQPIVTHPLGGRDAQRLLLSPRGNSNGEGTVTSEELEQLTPENYAFDTDTDIQYVSELIKNEISGWTNATPVSLKRDYLIVWRRLRGSLSKGDPLWMLMPADTRCPDHSIWDHLKMTCALCFMVYQATGSKASEKLLPQSRTPWLLRFSLGPIQDFIRQSRTSRDLWTSSFLLAELTWQAIEVFITRYGPDCIIYPDLNGNPRADCWLAQEHEGVLEADYKPNTFAAMIPGTFLAVVPQGGEAYLSSLTDLVEEAKQAVEVKWQDLQRTVFNELTQKLDSTKSEWQSLWRQQHKKCPLEITWSAIPWTLAEPIQNAKSLDAQALPAIEASRRPEPASNDDHRAIEQRRQRLKPWVPGFSWQAYEQARRVFANSSLRYLQLERGFDYALTHHQLLVRHHLRNHSGHYKSIPPASGEKCTLCGEREALPGSTNAHKSLQGMLSHTRNFWKAEFLDPEQEGAERLCAICTMKRFLIQAGRDGFSQTLCGLTPIWAGPMAEYSEIVGKEDRVQIPFPSSSMIAAQGYLADLAKYKNQLQPQIDKFLRACKSAGLQRTAFPGALPQLQVWHRVEDNFSHYLEYDPQYSLFASALDGEIQRQRSKNPSQEKSFKELKQALIQLHSEYRRIASDQSCSLNSRIAVIKMDGDGSARLLRGDGDKIGARWRDILHPEMINRIVDDKQERNSYIDAGWPELLEAKRLSGPSLQAFISRAMANFAHIIVPWVVEREFSGRLIYCGGDDVLCMAPAADALRLAARLQTLWSAAWVIDTGNPDKNEQSEWAWRFHSWQGIYDRREAAKRFQIVKEQLPDPFPPEAQLFPMLGSAASLSASIVYGHYKMPMGAMQAKAEDLLKHQAKRYRRSVAVALYSRNTLKAEFVLPWSEPLQPPDAHSKLEAVIEAFRRGHLPGRLPYKLREYAKQFASIPEVSREQRKQLIEGAVDKVMAEIKPTATRVTETVSADETGIKRLRELVLSLWLQGCEFHKDKDRWAVDGLLFCRSMASVSEEDD